MSPSGEPKGEDAAQAQATLQQMTNGYWVTQIIYVAAKLGIADLLKDGPRTIQALARSTKTHAPSLYLQMLALSGGRERREDEYRALLAAANLELVRIIPTRVPRSVIEALPR